MENDLIKKTDPNMYFEPLHLTQIQNDEDLEMSLVVNKTETLKVSEGPTEIERKSRSKKRNESISEKDVSKRKSNSPFKNMFMGEPNKNEKTCDNANDDIRLMSEPCASLTNPATDKPETQYKNQGPE